MSRVIIDDQYQIQLPKDLRTSDFVKPGAEVEITFEDGELRIHPVNQSNDYFSAFPEVRSDSREERDAVAKIRSIRGILPGIDTTIEDDPEDPA